MVGPWQISISFQTASDITIAHRAENRSGELLCANRAPKVMGAPATAAQTHAILRARSGFDINQLASEYRALRASVLRLWTEAYQPGDINLEDVIRFNEAIDQALAESVQSCPAHGGEIHVRSDSAVTVFAVRLPRHNQASSP